MCKEKDVCFSKEHYTKKQEISIIQLVNHIGEKFKVTKRVPEMSVSETKVFRSKQEAIKQFEDWLK
ncbi:hypothetical protein HOC35_01965 [Candidatus Woesearchaeota archaeon]|jgi:hypothetical protein|nr:hypothetical protein [Candidatus Woesearchaeota archaeon]